MVLNLDEMKQDLMISKVLKIEGMNLFDVEQQIKKHTNPTKIK